MSLHIVPHFSKGFCSSAAVSILVLTGVAIARSQETPSRLVPYKQNYFLLTTANHWDETKFQFSFQFRLIDEFGLYLGYTQKSFWDAWDFGHSSPFRESNYNPELFYRYQFGADEKDNLQIGVEHESNGRDGAESRSWNRVYGQFSSLPLEWFAVRAKVWAPFVVAEENDNIMQYTGYGELELSVFKPGRADLLGLSVQVRKGTNFDARNGGFQAGVVFKPIELLFGEKGGLLNGSYYFQYYNGMGESLLLFDRPVKRFRIGVILTV